MRSHLMFFMCASTILLLAGCAHVDVIPLSMKDDCKSLGIRFYEPEPYLLVTVEKPAAPKSDEASRGTTTRTEAERVTNTDTGSKTETKIEAETKTETKTETQTAQSIIPPPAEPAYAITIIYLPNYTKGYRVVHKQGLGTAEGSMTLIDGWQLTQFNVKTDSKIPELLTAITGALKEAGGMMLTAEGTRGGIRPGLYRLEFSEETGYLIGLDPVHFP